jgi:hypothetical protein
MKGMGAGYSFFSAEVHATTLFSIGRYEKFD